jgi:hypothetical protein
VFRVPNVERSQENDTMKRRYFLRLYPELERRAGIGPANTGFANLRVSRFATGAFRTIAICQRRLKPNADR